MKICLLKVYLGLPLGKSTWVGGTRKSPPTSPLASFHRELGAWNGPSERVCIEKGRADLSALVWTSCLGV